MALIRGEQITGSVGTASLAVSASYSTNALSSSFALTASYVETAQTASYVLQAVSSSFASTASYVEIAQTASYALNAVSSSFATSASYTIAALSSSYALTASYAGDYTLLSEFRQFTSSYELASASFDSRIIANSASIALLSSSYNTGSFTGSFTGSLLGTASWSSNSITSSHALDALSSSYALTASYVNDLNQNILISGSLTVIGNSIFYGSSSFVYVTASQLAVSASFISVNVFEPVERFGGLKVYDSGSSNATASLAWDSLHNHWVYQNVSGSTYTGGMFLAGPRNFGSLGDEPSLTKWLIPRSDGGDHLDNSQIFSSGSITIVTGSLTATQGITGSFTGSYIGDGAGLYNIPSAGIVGLNLSQIQSGSVSASISPVDGLQINTNVTATSFSGSFSGSGADLSNIPAAAIVGLNLSQIQSGSVSASISPNLGLQINTTVTATSFTGSLFGTASWSNNAITASYILNAVSSSFATTASFAQTSSYAFNAVTSSYALTASYIDGGFY